MEKIKANINYDEPNDVLYIYKEGSVKGNIKMGNFVIDITSKGNVIGLEILDATKTLPNFSKELLKSATGAKIVIIKKGDSITIIFGIISNMQPEKEATLVIPSIIKSKDIELV